MEIYYLSINCSWLCSLDTIFQCKYSIFRIWHYKVTKLILNTNMNIPKSALFLELRWEPISDYLDRQRVSYFARIKKLPITRLCKLVLMEVENSNTSSGWKYLDHLKFVFNNIGLDHLINNEIT